MSEDMAAAASRMYPSANAAPAAPAQNVTPAQVTKPAPAQTATVQQQQQRQQKPAADGTTPAATPRPPQQGGEQPPLTVQGDSVPPEPAPLTDADRLYDAPPVSAQGVQALMTLPADPEAAGFAVGPEAAAERQEAAKSLHEAGLSRGELGQAWQFAVRATHPGYSPPDADATEAALRHEWGADFDRNLGVAKAFVGKIIAQSPAVARHLRETGLQNDAGFIRAVAATALRRGA
jgi:hypothetical protein